MEISLSTLKETKLHTLAKFVLESQCFANSLFLSTVFKPNFMLYGSLVCITKRWLKRKGAISKTMCGQSGVFVVGTELYSVSCEWIFLLPLFKSWLPDSKSEIDVDNSMLFSVLLLQEVPYCYTCACSLTRKMTKE